MPGAWRSFFFLGFCMFLHVFVKFWRVLVGFVGLGVELVLWSESFQPAFQKCSVAKKSMFCEH